MLEYFINLKEQQKLEIIQVILLSINGKSSNYLINEFQIKQSTFQRYMKELQDDLSKVFENKVSLIVTSKKTFKIIVNDNITPDYIIPLLKKYYMEQSSLYIILSALISKKYDTIAEIAIDLNFSQPTVYKNISIIRKLLSSFDADIDLNNSSNFKGNELGIRYFLYLTYWHLFNVVNKKPFSDQFHSEFIDIDVIKKNLNIKKDLSKTQESKLIILSGIFSNRVVSLNKYISVDDHFLKDIELFYDGHSVINRQKFNLSTSAFDNEAKLFSFFIRGIISEFDSYEEKKQIVFKFKTSDLPVAKNISKFLGLFKDTFSFNYQEESYIESYYLLIFTYIYFNHIKFNVDHYFAVPIEHNIKSFKSKEKYQQIENKIDFLITQFPLKEPLNSTEKDYFSSLFFIIYELNNKIQPINIYVNHTSNIANAVYIKKNLANFFSPHLISFCNSPSESDIIISSAPEGDFNSKQIFYFENIFNQDSWESLITFLSNYLYKNKLK